MEVIEPPAFGLPSVGPGHKAGVTTESGAWEALHNPIGTHRAEGVRNQNKWTEPMKDTAANRKLLTVLVLLGASWVLFFQPASHWSAAIQISSVRIAFSLQSDTVRFRTPVS